MKTTPTFVALALLALAGAGCKPDYPKCQNDDHCKEHGEFCIQNQCRECGADGQCKEGYVCREYTCMVKPECVASADCPTGQRCRTGKCAPECDVAEDCANMGQKCMNGRCVAQDACTDNTQCRDTEQCKAGRCEPAAMALASTPSEAAFDWTTCELKTVHFEFNDWALSTDARAALDFDSECMKHRTDLKHITIEGHCDERGTEEYNLALGEKRANAVRKYLMDLGVDASRMRTLSFGKEKPADPGHDEDAWRKNRRADFARPGGG
jgi:peptidoglycan-associated lipoprotein